MVKFLQRHRWTVRMKKQQAAAKKLKATNQRLNASTSSSSGSMTSDESEEEEANDGSNVEKAMVLLTSLRTASMRTAQKLQNGQWEAATHWLRRLAGAMEEQQLDMSYAYSLRRLASALVRLDQCRTQFRLNASQTVEPLKRWTNVEYRQLLRQKKKLEEARRDSVDGGTKGLLDKSTASVECSSGGDETEDGDSRRANMTKYEVEMERMKEMLQDTSRIWREHRESVHAYLRLTREYHEEAEAQCSRVLDEITIGQVEPLNRPPMGLFARR